MHCIWANITGLGNHKEGLEKLSDRNAYECIGAYSSVNICVLCKSQETFETITFQILISGGRSCSVSPSPIRKKDLTGAKLP